MMDSGRARGRAARLILLVFFPIWALILGTATWTIAGTHFVLGLPVGIFLAILMYVPLAFVGWRRPSAIHQLETELERRGMTLLEVHNTWPNDTIRFLAVDHNRGIDVTGVILINNPCYIQFAAQPLLEADDEPSSL